MIMWSLARLVYLTWQMSLDLTRIRQLFDVFTAKQDILHLLDQCLNADGVQIFIGEESGYAPLGECSMVTALTRQMIK